MNFDMKILFLTYLNRSGSTFLANQLSKSPEICVCPESDILYELLLTNPLKEFYADRKKFWYVLNELEKDKKFSLWNFNRIELFDKISTCRNSLEICITILTCYTGKHKPDASVVLFKNSELIRLIAALPESAIKHYNLEWIGLTRDIRAIYVSQSTTYSPHTGKPMCTNPYSLALQWNSFIKQSISYNELNYFHNLRYEDLIQDTHMVITNITAALGVNYQLTWIYEKKGDIDEVLSQEYHEIHPLVNQLPDKSRVYHWKQLISNSQHSLFIYLCKKDLERCGYNPENGSGRFNPILYSKITRQRIAHYIKKFKLLSKSFLKKCLA
jgi:hypothetical protein